MPHDMDNYFVITDNLVREFGRTMAKIDAALHPSRADDLDHHSRTGLLGRKRQVEAAWLAFMKASE